ncbi:UDP-N-acetylmuramate--L-alanine ligase [Leminorella grimontii]|nr:UDP-N-acetylmuramate--L-alanine ligase [Leminorella grimontii]
MTNADELPQMLSQVISGGDLVLMQGAGNIGRMARRLAELKLQPINTNEESHG